MAKYYFVGTYLPDLNLDRSPELSSGDLSALLCDLLEHADLKKVRTLYVYNDIENLRSLWQGKSLQLTSMNHDVDVEENKFLPNYVHRYLEEHGSLEDRLRHIPQLVSTYFKSEIEKAQGFLKNYLNFEKEWRLIQAAYRARQLNRDLALELQFEDPEDPFIFHLLSQKDAPSFEPPEGFEALKTLLNEHYHSPIDLYKAFCAYKFQKIEEMEKGAMFTIDHILAYLTQLMLVEHWQKVRSHT